MLSKKFISPEGVEVRMDSDGTIDEIVSNHGQPVSATFEYMDDDHIDIHIGDVQVTVWTKKAKIHTGAEGPGFCVGEFGDGVQLVGIVDREEGQSLSPAAESALETFRSRGRRGRK